MSKDFTVIAPRTVVDPITTIEKGENHIEIKMGYTQAIIDELTRKANAALDEAVMDRLAKQHGYVSVVRCKDCRYFKPELYNYITCEFLLYNTSADDFCSYGERKSNDD